MEPIKIEGRGEWTHCSSWTLGYRPNLIEMEKAYPSMFYKRYRKPSRWGPIMWNELWVKHCPAVLSISKLGMVYAFAMNEKELRYLYRQTIDKFLELEPFA